MGTVFYKGQSIPIIVESTVLCKDKAYGLSKDEDNNGYSIYEIAKGKLKMKMHLTVEYGAKMRLGTNKAHDLLVIPDEPFYKKEDVLNVSEIMKKII